MSSPTPHGCRGAPAPDQAPVHHRPGWPKRLPNGLGPADGRGWPRGLGRGGADASSTARPPSRCSPRSRSTARALPDDPFNLEEAERRWETLLRRNAAARAALSSALHDLVGKRLGVPVYRIWGLDPCQGAAVHLHHRARHARADPGEGAGGGAVSDPQDQARHRPRRRDPAGHPRRHRQGDPGGRQLRLDREAGHPDAAGARGVRRDGAGAAAAARGSRWPRRDHGARRRSR